MGGRTLDQFYSRQQARRKNNQRDTKDVPENNTENDQTKRKTQE